jgi:biopolymer transport protein ExbB
MIPLLALSIIALGIIGERYWTLRRKSVLPPRLTEEVRQWVRTHRMEKDHIAKLRDNSPLGAVLASVISNKHRPRDIVREKVEEAGRQQVHELGRFLTTLGTIAIISPLMGLLGTVFGLIRMFLVITSVGIGDAAKLSGGIGEALVATAAGLTVAIIAYMSHRALKGRIQNYAVEMEREAASLIDAFDHPEATPSAAPAAPARPRA